MPQYQPNPDPGFFSLLAGFGGGLDRMEEQQRLMNARANVLRGGPPPPSPDDVMALQQRQAVAAGVPELAPGPPQGGASGSWGPPQPPQAPPPASGPRLPRALAARPQMPPQAPQPMPQQQGQPAPQQPIAPPAGLDDFQAREAALEAQRTAAMADLQRTMAPPDMAGAQEQYAKRAAAAPQHLLMALAATEAGNEFKPLSQHFLRQAEEAGSPMKTAGGTMTPEGFVADPTYGQAMAVRSAEARVASIERALQNNMTAAERARLERERIEARKEAQAALFAQQTMLAQQADETRRFVAGLTHGAKGQGAAPGKILPTKTIADLTEAEGRAASVGRLAQSFKPQYGGIEGAAMNIAGKLPGVDTEAAEWWRNYKKEAELIERHALFGASLTAGEQAAWRAADINPSMAPAAIARNLQRRQQIAENMYRKAVGNYGRSGYNTEAFQTPEQPQAAPQPQPQAPAAARPGRVVDFNDLK